MPNKNLFMPSHLFLFPLYFLFSDSNIIIWTEYANAWRYYFSRGESRNFCFLATTWTAEIVDIFSMCVLAMNSGLTPLPKLY